MVGRQTGRDRSSKICKGSEGTRRRDLLPDKQTFQRANKMGACPRECVPKLRVTEPLLCTKTFIPFYPNTLPGVPKPSRASRAPSSVRSEEHTSELQSQSNLVCRLLLEKKKYNIH